MPGSRVSARRLRQPYGARRRCSRAGLHAATATAGVATAGFHGVPVAPLIHVADGAGRGAVGCLLADGLQGTAVGLRHGGHAAELGRLRYGSGARQFHVCNAIRVALAVVLLASASSAGALWWLRRTSRQLGPLDVDPEQPAAPSYAPRCSAAQQRSWPCRRAAERSRCSLSGTRCELWAEVPRRRGWCCARGGSSWAEGRWPAVALVGAHLLAHAGPRLRPRAPPHRPRRLQYAPHRRQDGRETADPRTRQRAPGDRRGARGADAPHGGSHD
mmetsp:Transcript_114055/g.318541  ORF Transcript_114055/g.318541 Transcript_114055/m.318541 type:complete len:273 (-) Transcript_114055:382-1200(-)